MPAKTKRAKKASPAAAAPSVLAALDAKPMDAATTNVVPAPAAKAENVIAADQNPGVYPVCTAKQFGAAECHCRKHSEARIK